MMFVVAVPFVFCLTPYFIPNFCRDTCAFFSLPLKHRQWMGTYYLPKKGTSDY